MTLLSLLLTLVVVCVLLWAVRVLIGATGVPPPVATVIYVLVVLIVVVWLLQIMTGLSMGRVLIR